MKKLMSLAMILVAVFSDQSSGQESGFFSKNGVNSLGGQSNESTLGDSENPFGFLQGSRSEELQSGSRFGLPKWQLPRLKTPKWEMPKLFQGGQFPNPIQLSDSKGMKAFSFPKWELPARDPSQPNFFQRMNARTKEIFGRTRDSFNNATGSAFDDIDRTAKGSFDKITRGLNGDIGGSGNRNQPPVQPRLRSATKPEGSTSKF